MTLQKEPPAAAKITLYTIPEAVAIGQELGWPVTRKKLDKAVAHHTIQYREDADSKDNQGNPRVFVEHGDYMWWLDNVMLPKKGHAAKFLNAKKGGEVRHA